MVIDIIRVTVLDIILLSGVGTIFIYGLVEAKNIQRSAREKSFSGMSDVLMEWRTRPEMASEGDENARLIAERGFIQFYDEALYELYESWLASERQQSSFEVELVNDPEIRDLLAALTLRTDFPIAFLYEALLLLAFGDPDNSHDIEPLEVYLDRVRGS